MGRRAKRGRAGHAAGWRSRGVPPVAAGQADVVITLASEIMQAPGLELVGPLPGRFQNYVHFAAGVSVKARNAEAANALIRFLTSPKAAPTFSAKGIQPQSR